MSAPRKRILFFGHSHVRNLGDVIKSKNLYKNFKINRKDILVKIKGIGGLKIKDLVDKKSAKYHEFHRIMVNFVPTTLCLMVGCNDIGKDSSAEEVAALLQVVFSILKTRYNLDLIVFTQLLPRLQNKWVDFQLYNTQAEQVNSDMLEWAQECPSRFYKWLKFKFPKTPILLKKLKKSLTKDGVHLTQSAYRTIFQALRHIVILAIKFSHPST